MGPVSHEPYSVPNEITFAMSDNLISIEISPGDGSIYVIKVPLNAIRHTEDYELDKETSRRIAYFTSKTIGNVHSVLEQVNEESEDDISQMEENNDEQPSEHIPTTSVPAKEEKTSTRPEAGDKGNTNPAQEEKTDGEDDVQAKLQDVCILVCTHLTEKHY